MNTIRTLVLSLALAGSFVAAASSANAQPYGGGFRPVPYGGGFHPMPYGGRPVAPAVLPPAVLPFPQRPRSSWPSTRM